MRRIALKGFSSAAHVGHDDPERSRRAQSAPVTKRFRQKPLFTGEARLRVIARRSTGLREFYAIDASGGLPISTIASERPRTVRTEPLAEWP
jgi:hypothetical protein